MIDDSAPWKRDIAIDAAKLETALVRYRSGASDMPSDNLYYKIERFCFVNYYVIRRLFDAEKLSEELESTTVVARVFKKRTRDYRPLDVMTKGDVQKRYVIGRARRKRLSLLTLCNMLVHTADFVVSVHPKRSLRILFTSSKHARELFEVSLADLLRLATHTAEDDIVYEHMVRNPKSGALEIVVRSRVIPTSNLDDA
jgi:hypothetical protein